MRAKLKEIAMLYFGNREPPLDEVFDDPIVRLLMARDGLPPDEARACVERMRAALRARLLKATQSKLAPREGFSTASFDDLVGAVKD
jgi:hypothetical protein